MDIIIKSFNRLYYLDRCLKSIYKFISGSFKITILDDGTPPIYLNKIQHLYPEVSIIRSDLYDSKVNAIKDYISGLKVNNFLLWYSI